MTDSPAVANKPKAVDLFIAAVKAKKAAEAQEKKYRPEVLAFCKEFGSLPELEYTSYSKTELHHDKILEWVKDSYGPEISNQVTKPALDLEAFEILVKKGVIDSDKMPRQCYTETPVDKLQTTKESK
jgi:hypothetical protein